MSMRGVSKQGALTASTCFLGDFATDATRRLEFLVSARGGGGGGGDLPALRAQATSDAPAAAAGAGGGCSDSGDAAPAGGSRPDR